MYNHKTDWDLFRENIDLISNSTLPWKAIINEHLTITKAVQAVAWKATHIQTQIKRENYPVIITK